MSFTGLARSRNDMNNHLSDLIFKFSILFLVFLLFVQACSNLDNEKDSEVFSIDGLIIEVEALSLVETISITLLDNFGEEHKLFLEGNYRAFTPSHLREHMIFGMPVSIEYVVKEEKWKAIDISDESELTQHQ